MEDDNQQAGDHANREKDVRLWAMLLHLSPLVGWIIGPLVVWLIKKDEMPELEPHFNESMNFHIVQLVAFIIAFALTFISCGFLFPLLFIPVLMTSICSIIAAVKANNGEPYTYPMVFFKALDK